MSVIYSKGDLIDPVSGEVLRTLRPLLYVSGPMFSQGNLLVNVRVAALYGKVAYQRGWAPVVPHLDILSQLITGEFSPEPYLDVDLSILASCKALVTTTREWDAYTKEGKKTGTQQEVELAESLGIPVYITTSELPWL